MFTLIPQAYPIVQTNAQLDITILEGTQIAKKSANFTAAKSSNIVDTLADVVSSIRGSPDVRQRKVCVIVRAFTWGLTDDAYTPRLGIRLLHLSS